MADARFRELVTPWRHRAFPLLAGIAAVGLVFLAAGLLLPGNVWKLVLGMAAGAFLILPWIIYENPPARIQNWRWGSEAEVKTARQLQRLPAPEWRVWHDLRRANGTNVDHIVAGPPGIFVLDTKDLTGILDADGDKLVLHMKEDASARTSFDKQLAAARGLAVELNRLLSSHARIGMFVRPVVVCWGSFPARRAESEGVVVVHGLELTKWLQGLSARRYASANVVEFFDRAEMTGLPQSQKPPVSNTSMQS